MDLKNTRLELAANDGDRSVSLKLIRPANDQGAEDTVLVEDSNLNMALATGVCTKFKELGVDTEAAFQVLDDAETRWLDTFGEGMKEQFERMLKLRATRLGGGMVKVALVMETELFSKELPLNAAAALMDSVTESDLPPEELPITVHPDTADLTPSAEHVDGAFNRLMEAIA